jgi:hypothetical protein
LIPISVVVLLDHLWLCNSSCRLVVAVAQTNTQVVVVVAVCVAPLMLRVVLVVLKLH